MLRSPARLYRFIRDVLQEFAEDRGSLFAAAMSYFGLISLIPALLLAVSIFGYIIGSYESARERVASFLQTVIPVGSTVLENNLRAISEQSGVLAWIGTLGLIWIGTQVFVNLQEVMNVAMGADTRVSFLRARGVALITLVVAGVMLALSLGATSLLSALQAVNPRIFGNGLRYVWNFLAYSIPFVFSVLAFSAAYRFLPTKRIGNKAPILGGITAGVLFEIAKHTFKWYVLNIANYDLVYGSLGGAVVLVVWIYFVSAITVLGAEVASVYARWVGEYRKTGG